jgi:hypothetical protein
VGARSVDDLPSSYHLVRFACATARVTAQAQCSTDDATDLMIDHCDNEGCSLGVLALAVVQGRIRFDG